MGVPTAEMPAAAHAREPDDVLGSLSSSREGLSSPQAAEHRGRFGENRLPEPEKDGPVKRFFRLFNDALIYVLLAAAVVTAVLAHWIDTAVIVGVVLINTVIGFVQEGKAEEALAGIRRMLSSNANVRRDGAWTEIEAEQVVPGDVVRLRAGDRVPADLRLFEATGLRIEESALTGEAEPSDKETGSVPEDAGIGDRHSMAFSGTMVAAGSGVGVVTATGSETEIGRINAMISEVEELATPLTRTMNQFGKVLSLIVVAMALVLLVIGWLHDYSLDELFLAAISFAVAAIPEGLPAILTITLARGVELMAKRNAITRRLNAVETLGSVTVICSDKTGTLTRNEMTVREVVTGDGTFAVEGTGYAPEGSVMKNGTPATVADHHDLASLVEVMALANDTVLERRDQEWGIVGEPTEGSLTTLAHKASFDPQDAERIAEVPFDSANKLMATLTRFGDGSQRILMKGAPDRLLERCTYQGSSAASSTPLERAAWAARVEELGGQGLRVLAGAMKDGSGLTSLGLDDLDDGFVFVGLVGIIDPPRPEAIAAIEECRQAGIRVKMITGDHAGTAAAIGHEMGIGEGAPAVTGAELERASDDELRGFVQDRDIFARTSPEHKLRLVTALQAEGQVVAMTGDGVNDAPALKRADVGVAMGIKGTEATKEAADVVLADDNFSSIARAVNEGRTIYDNLRKAVVFTLPTNGAQSLVVLSAIVAGLVLPLTPLQILWVNMVIAVTLAMAIAFEPAEPGVMARPPRDPGEALLDKDFAIRITLVSLLIGGATVAVFLFEVDRGIDVDTARTVAVNTLVLAQLFYLFNCRYLHTSSLRPALFTTNPVAWFCVAILLVLQLGFVYAPFMNTWFGSRPVALEYWALPVGVGVAVFLIVELIKLATRGLAPGSRRTAESSGDDEARA